MLCMAFFGDLSVYFGEKCKKTNLKIFLINFFLVEYGFQDDFKTGFEEKGGFE